MLAIASNCKQLQAIASNCKQLTKRSGVLMLAMMVSCLLTSGKGNGQDSESGMLRLAQANQAISRARCCFEQFAQ